MAGTHLSIHPRIAVCTYNTIRLAFQQLLQDRSSGIAMSSLALYFGDPEAETQSGELHSVRDKQRPVTDHTG